ncbi:MAG: hypothetical protein AAB370_07710 [Verrucomicrobiota bacterium]
MKIPCYKGLSWLGILALSVNCAVAALTTTSSFTAISGGVFVNGAGYSLLQPYNSGPLTITPSFNFGSGTFSGYTPPGVPGEPGDGNGFLASFRAPSPNGDLTLDFSTPVAAFGATFIHLDATTLRRWGLHLPGTIRAYDGPNGTGNLLGSVNSSGWFASSLGYNFDFVGVMSASQNIQSVVIGGSVEPKGFGLDGYAYSLTPVPEPMTASIICLGLTSVICLKRRHRR